MAARRVSKGGPWISLTVLSLGLISLLMLLGATRVSERLVRRDSDRHHAIQETRTALATAHLWLEELLTGDRVDAAEIASNLERARSLIGGLVDPAIGARLDPPTVPFEDPVLRDTVESIRARLEEFRAISIRRQEDYLEQRDVGVGSPIDARYDGLFVLLFDETRGLERRLGERQVENRARARALLGAIAASWVMIVGLAVGGLWSRERRRARAEAALREREAQLQRARKMDAIGRLAGGVAHDINNYLAAIRSQAELARDKTGDDGTARKMESILRSVANASELIDRLLAIGRRQPVRPAILDLNSRLDALNKTLLGEMVGETIRMECRLSPDLWMVEADPSQIEQVILNLVVNACEAMLSGGRIDVETANRRLSETDSPVRAGDYVMLAVSDTGVGIPVEMRDRIFEPFFSTKDPSGNSGLGLATVHGIVEQAGGTVTVDSEVGRGTTFRVYLPRCGSGESDRQ